jgi:16S rRNA (guanine1207-N2)-methyltransferase
MAATAPRAAPPPSSLPPLVGRKRSLGDVAEGGDAPSVARARVGGVSSGKAEAVAAARFDARALNARLSACVSAAAVLEVVSEALHAFNDVNCATALSKLARWRTAAAPPGLTLLVRHATDALAPSRPRSNGRTLTSIAHSVGLLHPTLAAAPDGGACARACLDALAAAAVRLPSASLDAGAPGALATALWAIGTLQHAPGGTVALCAAAAAAAANMSAHEVSLAAWGAARGRVRHSALASALAKAAVARAGAREFSPQGLCNTAWAWAKLKTPNPRLFDALAAAAVAMLHAGAFASDARALATLGWAFGRVHPHAGLNAALCVAVRDTLRAQRLPQQSIASLLQSLSADDAPGVDAAVLPLLAHAALQGLHSASAQDVGLIAAAIAKGKAGECTAATAAALAARVVAVAEDTACDMDWRGVAFCELALCHAMSGTATKKKTKESAALAAALAALATRATAAAAAVCAASAAAALRPQSLLLQLWAQPGGVRASFGLPPAGDLDDTCAPLAVLLIGDDPHGALTAQLARTPGVTVTHWRRLACEGAAPGAPPACVWPTGPGGGSGGDGDDGDDDGALFDAAVLRAPPCTARGALFAAHGAAARLRGGAPLLVCGNTAEGCASAALLGKRLFDAAALLASSPDGGAAVLRAPRRATEAGRSSSKKCCVAGWRAEQPPLHAAPTPWVVYPGLFAGGGLDVMTAALLAALPPPPRRARVCDFAAGSGALAAGLLAREPTLRLTLLDADALALHAAAQNVPPAACVLSDGWAALPPARKPRKRFAWVVSNPPVHAGAADDLAVLQALLAGAPARLAPGGSLWVVSQAQVPVGRLAAAAGGLADCTPLLLEGGRFVAWHARAPGADGEALEEEE